MRGLNGAQCHGLSISKLPPRQLQLSNQFYRREAPNVRKSYVKNVDLLPLYLLLRSRVCSRHFRGHPDQVLNLSLLVGAFAFMKALMQDQQLSNYSSQHRDGYSPGSSSGLSEWPTNHGMDDVRTIG